MHVSKYSFFIKIIALSIFLFSFSGCASSPPLKEMAKENILTYHIVIPEIERDYNLLFLTDTHITIPHKSQTKEIKDYSSERLFLFTNGNNTSSSEMFPAWINYANGTGVDALLLGGDIIDCPSDSNIKYLNTALKDLKNPYVYTLGNHDWTYPWAYMNQKSEEEYLPLLSPYMNENPAIHTQEFTDFTVVAIDNSSNQIHPKALEEYKKILSEKKPVILLLHVPLYTPPLMEKAFQVWKNSVVLGGGIHGGIYPNKVSEEFLNLTTAKDSPVILILAGHVHFADYSYVTGEKDIPQITGDAGYKGKGTLIHITNSKTESASS